MLAAASNPKGNDNGASAVVVVECFLRSGDGNSQLVDALARCSHFVAAGNSDVGETVFDPDFRRGCLMQDAHIFVVPSISGEVNKPADFLLVKRPVSVSFTMNQAASDAAKTATNS